MYEIEFTSQFKKGLKQIKKQGRDLTKLEQIIDMLAKGELLPEKYHDHELKGNWLTTVSVTLSLIGFSSIFIEMTF